MPLTKYYCECGDRREIPVRPSDAKRTIRVGCDSCGYIRTHYQLGVT